MRTSSRTLFLILGPLLLACSLQAQQAQKGARPFSVDDLYLFDAPRAVVLSPKEKKAVYIRQWIDRQTKIERHSLWLVEDSRDKRRPMEAGEPDARHAIFSPDGRWLAFLSTRPRPAGWKPLPSAPPQSDPALDIWLMPTAGGQAIPLGGPEQAHGRVFHDGFYGRIAFSPDGTKLAFIADDGSDPRTREEIENDVIVVRPDQGEGYTGFGPAQVWVAHLADKPGKSAATRIDRLTKDDVWYGDPQWLPDGTALVLHANKTDDRESVRYSINKNFDLWAIDVATGKQRQLTTGPGPDVSPRISPDGKQVACLSVPRKGTHRDVFNLAVVNLAEAEPKTRILFDHHGPKADNPPHPRPSFPLPDNCWEGEFLHYSSEIGTTTREAKVDTKSGQGSLPGSAANVDVDPGTRQGRKYWQATLTPAGSLFLKERVQSPAKTVTWTNDGMTLEGILTTPPPAVAKAPYKMILYPHGGPHSRAAHGFDFTVQIFAAHGYAVFQPNFRGSFGYGQKFVDADRADFGGGDMRDILSGIDKLIKEGVVDSDRQYVYGISYGGYMTSWLVGQTHQFRAAVAQNAVTDLAMMWGLTDIQSWTEWEFHGRPWKSPDLYRKHSPLTYADKVKTPTLILHARDDRRCPLPMGKAFHQALLARGVPTQMVIYPNEGHGIRQPRHREDVLRRVLAWFATF